MANDFVSRPQALDREMRRGVTEQKHELTAIDYDVAIRQRQLIPLDTQALNVLSEALGIVVSPALVRSRRLRSADLSWVNLLESESRPGELDRWLDISGTHPPQGKRRRYPHFYIGLEAAL